MFGFGSAEIEYEKSVEQAIREFVAETFPREDQFFTDSFFKQVKSHVDGMAAESRAMGDKHKDSLTYPDRYSYFWVTTIGDACHIVFIVKFHHINRRHTASPDGWALMTSEKIFYVYEPDIAARRRESAEKEPVAT